MNVFLNAELLNLYQKGALPPEYDKSNTGIRTDPEENM